MIRALSTSTGMISSRATSRCVYAFITPILLNNHRVLLPLQLAQARRKKGKNLDRIEFGMLDGRGYGLSVVKRDGEYYATMAAMPADQKQEFRMVWLDSGPRLVGMINGTECYMEKMCVLYPYPRSQMMHGGAIYDNSDPLLIPRDWVCRSFLRMHCC